MAASVWRRWPPRLVLLLFILSLVLPLPRYLGGLEAGEFSLWLGRLAWVAGLAALMIMAGLLGRWARRRRG